MSEQTVAERVGVLREQILALDEAIDLARNEAKRLDASAKARASLIRLERAVTASAVQTKPSVSASDVPKAPESENPVPVLASHGDEPAFGHVAEEQSRSVVQAPEPAKEAEVTPLSVVAPTPHLSVVQDVEEPVTSATAGDEPAFGEPIRDPKKPQESSPLTVVDADVEAAFDKFFSAEVEPEPAQQWLLSD